MEAVQTYFSLVAESLRIAPIRFHNPSDTLPLHNCAIYLSIYLSIVEATKTIAIQWKNDFVRWKRSFFVSFRTATVTTVTDSHQKSRPTNDLGTIQHLKPVCPTPSQRVFRTLGIVHIHIEYQETTFPRHG